MVVEDRLPMARVSSWTVGDLFSGHQSVERMQPVRFYDAAGRAVGLLSMGGGCMAGHSDAVGS